jgi:ribonuclease D
MTTQFSLDKTHTMLIQDNAELLHLCQRLQQSAVLFVDTEFLREKTYYSTLCLIQIAGEEGEAAAIDCLAKDIDLQPLFSLLNDPSRLKIMHAGRQDMEIFFQHTQALPAPFFDTQIAAMILGLGEQMGYDSLVKHFLGKHVCKSQQFTDWSRRPLSDEQLEYALDDVRHLRKCYPRIVDELKKFGRTAWVEEETAYLLNPNLYSNLPENAWLRIRKRDTKPYYLARLQHLAAWREREAKARNVPRGTIIHDDTLQEIALTNPKTVQALLKVRGISKRPEKLEAIYAILHEANALPKEECPIMERKSALPKEDDIVRDALKLLLKCKAKEYNVSPSLLCDSEGLQQLIERDHACTALQSWRKEIFGDAAIKMLDGSLTVSVTNGRVSCVVN